MTRNRSRTSPWRTERNEITSTSILMCRTFASLWRSQILRFVRIEPSRQGYMRAIRPEYWIVNVSDRSVEVFRSPSNNGYAPPVIFRSDRQSRHSLLRKPRSTLRILWGDRRFMRRRRIARHHFGGRNHLRLLRIHLSVLMVDDMRKIKLQAPPAKPGLPLFITWSSFLIRRRCVRARLIPPLGHLLDCRRMQSGGALGFHELDARAVSTASSNRAWAFAISPVYWGAIRLGRPAFRRSFARLLGCRPRRQAGRAASPV